MQNKFQCSSYNDEALQGGLRVLLHLCRGLFPRPQQIPNSVDAQVPSVKRCSAVGPSLSAVTSRIQPTMDLIS